MPYYITDEASGCGGWAVVKDDGEVMGCHTSKDAAIDQMVAVSLEEGIEPGGERSKGYNVTTVETRHITIDGWEFREDGDGMSFTGYAAVFNSPSEPLPFIETIAPGAFSRTLKSRNNVRMLLNHNPEKVLGSTRAKTLRLSEDSKGLIAEADLPPTTVGRDLSVLMKRGDIDSMSFGFTVPRGGDSWNDTGDRRELREVRLHEVSVVTFPAYPKTSASVRAVDILADKTGADADALSAALGVLENGQSLTRDQADLLSSVITELAPKPEPEPEPAPVDVKSALDLLRAQIDLAYKAI
jgi:HK97 family phage prohead protease